MMKAPSPLSYLTVAIFAISSQAHADSTATPVPPDPLTFTTAPEVGTAAADNSANNTSTDTDTDTHTNTNTNITPITPLTTQSPKNSVTALYTNSPASAGRQLTDVYDPTSQRVIANSYPMEVESFLSLSQAQGVLAQVSPKLAADQAAIAASEFQSQATETLDDPYVFARASANAYRVRENIDLSDAKSTIINDVSAFENAFFPDLPATGLPMGSEYLDAMLPNDYDLDYSDTNANAGLGVVWPVYTAGRTKALTGLVDARTEEAQADAIMNENDLYTTLVQRYFQAQLAIIAAYLREDAVDTLAQTDHLAQRMLEEGFISEVDRLEAKSALADARSDAVKAGNDARLAMMALQRMLRTEYRIKPTTPLFVSSKPLPSLEYFQQTALSTHPGLQKVAAKRHQAEKLHDLSDTGYKPTVSVYGYTDIDNTPSWFAGVSASWKLWGGLDNDASMAASSAQMRQADLSAIEVSDNLLLLVEKNWHEVTNAQSRYQALQSNVDLAAEVLRYRRLGLQEGVNTTVDVVQAQTQYLKARTEQAQAANDYVQALAALMQSCGTPLEFNTYMNTADIHLPTLYEQAERQTDTHANPAAASSTNSDTL